MKCVEGLLVISGKVHTKGQAKISFWNLERAGSIGLSVLDATSFIRYALRCTFYFQGVSQIVS